jgi:hypothetical protein
VYEGLEDRTSLFIEPERTPRQRAGSDGARQQLASSTPRPHGGLLARRHDKRPIPRLLSDVSRAQRAGSFGADNPSVAYERHPDRNLRGAQGRMGTDGYAVDNSRATTTLSTTAAPASSLADPFLEALLHTVPAWRAIEYDSDARGYCRDARAVPLYCLPDTTDFADVDARARTFLHPKLIKMLDYDRERFYRELFFMNRFAGNKAVATKRATLWSLSTAWDSFIVSIQRMDGSETSTQSSTSANPPDDWFLRFTRRVEEFKMGHPVGIKWNVHTLCAEFGSGCAVLSDCPFCNDNEPKMPRETRESPTLPDDLQQSIILYDSLSIGIQKKKEPKRVRK